MKTNTLMQRFCNGVFLRKAEYGREGACRVTISLSVHCAVNDHSAQRWMGWVYIPTHSVLCSFYSKQLLVILLILSVCRVPRQSRPLPSAGVSCGRSSCRTIGCRRCRWCGPCSCRAYCKFSVQEVNDRFVREGRCAFFPLTLQRYAYVSGWKSKMPK